MRQPFHQLRAAALACALCSASLAAFGQDAGDRTVAPAVAHKQKAEIAKGDPARWYRADRTEAARVRTLQKEIGAAYAEAKNACRKGAKAQRTACLKDARTAWQRDMKNAPQLAATAPAASVLTRVTTTMEAPQQASSMTGAAQAGQTGSGQAEPQVVTEQPRMAQPEAGKPIDDANPNPPPQR